MVLNQVVEVDVSFEGEVKQGECDCVPFRAETRLKYEIFNCRR